MITPDADDRARFQRLSRLLEEARPAGGDEAGGDDWDARLILDVAARAPGGDGGVEHETVNLPRAAVEALLEIARALAQGQALRIVPERAELTTQAAADLLGVSRPHLITLIDRGEIPHHMVGTHRRLVSDDVLAYRETRNRERRSRVRDFQRRSADVEGDAGGA